MIGWVTACTAVRGSMKDIGITAKTEGTASAMKKSRRILPAMNVLGPTN